MLAAASAVLWSCCAAAAGHLDLEDTTMGTVRCTVTDVGSSATRGRPCLNPAYWSPSFCEPAAGKKHCFARGKDLEGLRVRASCDRCSSHLSSTQLLMKDDDSLLPPPPPVSESKVGKC
eukprot:1491792-Amphidinium_carterae.1